MKQFISLLLLLVTVTTASGQNAQKAELNERFLDARVNEIAQQLNMTDEQKTKFTPVYRRYSEEMRALMGERRGSKPATDEEQLQQTKRRMERQQQAQQLRLRYVDEFATILSAEQVSKFFQVEKGIQKKVMHRKGQHHKGQHHKKDFHQKRMAPTPAASSQPDATR